MKSVIKQVLWFLLLCALPADNIAAWQSPAESAKVPGVLRISESVQTFLSNHCIECHAGESAKAGLALDSESTGRTEDQWELWEKVVRRLRVRQMPPAESVRPKESDYVSITAELEGMLDRFADLKPRPGRTEAFRRLTRTEYQNAIRDLLALKIDASALLPADESSHGFDNITVGDLSPVLLNRYIAAAGKISRIAVGRVGLSPDSETIRIRPDVTQEEHVAGLPLGTRGGALIPLNFPQDGEYEVQIRLTRDRNEEVEGLKQPHELELLLDRRRIQLLTVAPPADGRDFSTVDAHLKIRFTATAGPHDLGVTFIKKPTHLAETKRQPLNVRFNMHRHPRLTPAIFQVSVTGPFGAPVAGDTPSRQRIFTCRPASGSEKPSVEEVRQCAEKLLLNLMTTAYRRPATADDLLQPMRLFEEAGGVGDFEAGIEAAVSSVLVSPGFLFRIERDPPELSSGTPFRISDLELASRLSFFLWSSLPDDELLQLAAAGRLSQPAVLEQQTRRMLNDERSRALISNFVEQWLYLRNLESITPDARIFPDFDDNLRQAFRQETELFVQHVIRSDCSVTELLNANYTFLNERLAKHYGVPHVYGSHFRRVDMGENRQRGGLLRHGSILTVTSYATRTSPVIRGHWVLKNLIGAPPAPPPADVPALKDNTVAASLSVRDRLAEHRANQACAGCHNLMDPVGFAMENYDAVGRWRDREGELPIDATGFLADGQPFTGVSGLEQQIVSRPELFVGTMTEKLLTFALGRGVEYQDAPAIRRIVRRAERDGFCFSSIILGIVSSDPFQMRTAP